MATMGPSVPGHDEERKGEVMLSKTCQNCFSLKIRCDRTQRTDICDRCARLGKQCVFRPARRRDNSAKRDSRIQALEAQVQNLLRTKDPSHNAQQALPEGFAVPPAASSTTSTADGDVIDEDILTVERADTLVEMYKSEMMPHFPFIIIPAKDNGERLRREKPFLFLAIVTVASYHDLPAQEQLGNRFKRMVTEKVLYGGDECLKLEYLQGLLIILAWNQYHGQSKFFSQYLMLAVSLAVDNRLDRKPIRSKPTKYTNKRDPLVAGSPGTQTWGPEEQRAAAGIFYLSSTVSKLLDKMNTFPCTQYIEEGCLSLGQRAEYRTDKDLYHVIRLQRIIENIESLAGESSSEAEAHAAYVRVRTELEEFRMYLSNDVSDSHLLFMQFHTAKLFLYQVAFFERNLQQSPALHLNILCEGLESAKSFLDLYLWLPPKSEMALTNSEWVQLSFGVTQAAKFAIVSRSPNVEPQTRELRQRLNIDHVFRHLSLRIGALVGRAGEPNKHKDIFFYYETRVRKIQNWYEKMCRATRSDSPESQQQQQPQFRASASATPPMHTSSPYSSHTPPGAPPQHLQQQSQQPQQQYQQIPVPATYQHQQPLTWTTPPASMQSGMYQDNAATLGMAPMSTYGPYSPVPSIAFPDLMSAPGWDTLFTVPMEDISWMPDLNQGYNGMANVSPPGTDGSWRDPGNL
ncbi:hypothetical protein K458DRAFT_417339 [Lentithecium fluviatile CBS 122367]|uniref:Zn(2)-C6 fungal-type domain-containing protein n=1 Tax=Lentithecium fluviatile CBS 122367 TaxID=1168545 RepID=A0A6G1J429_9PLEO|nr:hypothetical protein K458DRAFT_417339 [Lentithecium fluviatile CBS 122367]